MDLRPMHLADAYEILWNSSAEPPDVFEYLRAHTATDQESIEVILVDQAKRWRSACPWRAEVYLTETPKSLASDPDFRYRLAMGEYQARASIGLSPSFGEFALRFPDIYKRLQRSFSNIGSEVDSQESMVSTLNAGINPNAASSEDQEGHEETSSSILFNEGELSNPNLGRYQLIMVIGTGSFGLVYLAYDEELDRNVAIKVPRANRFDKPESTREYLSEARTVANLSHPNIVPVYDLGTTEEGLIYVVSKYIEGQTLSDRIKRGRLSHLESAELLSKIALALEHAHERQLIHRDLKPGNILIETGSSTPYLTDFGLAIREEDGGLRNEVAGTPAYMSPEQVRGETHRLDGRSDIFSLGVILYELLTGQRPFQGYSAKELMKQVISCDPVNPRLLDPTIPEELERICLRALAKRATDRYPNARSIAEDLTNWNINSTPKPIQARLVPKGLRSFDADDASYFLDLLPGPRNRDGLPNSIQFWKTRIEQIDPEKSFRVGLIYGPSGCGKTSLVKAGLLPRLSKDIMAFYFEATPTGTENRILNAIRKSIPNLPVDLGLVETFGYLRRQNGQKIVIILDQFEQWLHAYRTEQDTELTLAFRQCDGSRIQTILMVRDDFWMAACRFMSDVEVEIAQGVNFAAVDLFTPKHAKKVLIAFGRAFGDLQDVLTEENQSFLDKAIQGLLQDGSIVSIQLAVFAEMIKGKPWAPETLDRLGGTDGVGVTFLEDSFSARTALPRNRKHQNAAKLVLSALMPELGSEIKGHKRSCEELMRVSGYQNEPIEFEELIKVLDRELRLITPTDFEESEFEPSDNRSENYYQLTHDFLVPSLREWITHKQQETRKGRAELKLNELSALWNSKPEDRHLPSPLEYLSIRIHTDKRKWTQHQKKMMHAARSVHGFQLALVLTGVLVFAAYGLSIRNAGVEQQRRAESIQIARGLLQAETSQVPSIIRLLEKYRPYARDELRSAVENSPEDSNAKLHAAMALIHRDPSVLDFIRKKLLSVNAVQFPYVRDILVNHKESVVEDYKKAIFYGADSRTRFQAACALATFTPNSEIWNDSNLCKFLADYLTSVEPSELLPWRNALRPIKDRLIGPLAAIFRNPKSDPQSQSFATYSLTDYLESDPTGLFELLIDSSERQFEELYSKIKAFPDTAIELGNLEISKKYPGDPPEEVKETLAIRQANAFVLLMRLNATENIWPLLKHSPDPRVRSYIIHWLRPRGASPRSLINRLKIETDLTIQRALTLALGEFPLSLTQIDELTPFVLEIYKKNPDPGLHSAAEWLLKTWGLSEALNNIDRSIKLEKALKSVDQIDNRSWFINSQNQTFVILPGTELSIGSLKSEVGRMDNETIHLCRIDRSIAVSTKEITRKQWQEFSRSNPNIEWQIIQGSSKANILADDSPMIGMTWYEAAWYCNWLSNQEGIPEEQWCYIPNPSGQYAEGMKAKDRFWELDGYRLPTEAEWEYACRAGTTSSRYYGQSEILLEKYAWYQSNGKNQPHPVASLKPNDFGLFDMYGNVYEWCFDTFEDYSNFGELGLFDHPNSDALNDMKRRVLRGGSFFFPEMNIRSASRSSLQPDSRPNLTHGGFRPVRSIR